MDGESLEVELERSPITLADVGARGGLPRHWEQLRDRLRLLSFEPDPEAFRELLESASAGHCLDVLLYKERTRLDFHVTRSRRLSSVLRPNRRFLERFGSSEAFDVIETIEVETDTLDHQLAVHGIQDLDFLKLDTQGSELPVLQGSVECLSRSVFGIETEVAFAPRYEEQPLFGEVDGFATSFGFGLMDLRVGYWKRRVGRRLGSRKGQMVLGEALYFREPEAFTRLLADLAEPERRRSKLLRALAICEVYGYADYAMELLDLSVSQGVLADDGFRQAVTERLSRHERDAAEGWATVSSIWLGNFESEGLFDYKPNI